MDAPADNERFALEEGVSLRQHAARGTLVNAAFNVGLTVLGAAKGLILPVFLTPDDYGIWGILLISLGTLTWLKQVGVADKYIQQDEADQQLAFQKAFTIELLVNCVLLAVLLAAVPLMALVYGRSELLAPGFALCLLIPALQLQAPFWILYRRLEFQRQRTLQAVDPLIAVLATIGLAAAGAGYWSLIIGTMIGSYAGAAIAWRTSPYPLAVRYDRGTLRSYARFSAPLFLASVGGIVFAQGSILIGEDAIGLAGAGAITLAAQISFLAQRVDDVVSTTLYPVICAAAERRDVLYETFTKSNRIALMWAMPFGVGLALFGPDLVRLVLGSRWSGATIAIQATALVAGVSQLGFNWTSYFRALGDTRPIAVASVAQAIAFALSAPLIYAYKLDGFAAVLGIIAVVNLLVRGYFLARLFAGFRMARHAARAFAPSLPALAAVLALRMAEGGGQRTDAIAALELGTYLAASVVATYGFERELIAEALGYLRRRRQAGTAGGAGAT